MVGVGEIGCEATLHLRLARGWRDDPDVTLLGGVECGPFFRPDPIWTNPHRSVADTQFHSPSAIAVDLLRPRFDGRNAFTSPPACEVASLPDATVGFDGIVVRGDRLFAFQPSSAIEEDLAYLARFNDLARSGAQIALGDRQALTACPDVYYEWRASEDPNALEGLRPIFEESRCSATVTRAPRAIRSCGRLANFISKRSYVYYYHVTHILPRLCLMRDLLVANPDVQILTSGVFDAHFELLGIGRDRLLQYDPTTLYESRELLASTPPPFLVPQRELLRLLRPAFVETDGTKPRCILFIRRSRAQRTAFRNRVCDRLGLEARVDVCVLENHDELLEVLRRRFPHDEVIDFDSDRFTPKEQIALFARARLIVGVHGSGLANLVFAPPDVRILELMPERSYFPVFWHLAAALDMRYAVHVVPKVTKYDNFPLPPADLIQAVNTLLNH